MAESTQLSSEEHSASATMASTYFTTTGKSTAPGAMASMAAPDSLGDNSPRRLDKTLRSDAAMMIQRSWAR